MLVLVLLLLLVEVLVLDEELVLVEVLELDEVVVPELLEVVVLLLELLVVVVWPPVPVLAGVVLELQPAPAAMKDAVVSPRKRSAPVRFISRSLLEIGVRFDAARAANRVGLA